MAATLADNIFKCNFINENVLNSLKISLKFVPRGPVNNKSSLVRVMACRLYGAKPLPELVMNVRHPGPMSYVSATHLKIGHL